MNQTEIEQLSDYEHVYIHEATASKLAAWIDPSIPWIWILEHCPNPHAQWWQDEVPLHTNGTRFTGLVRGLCFDLQLPTNEFISRAEQFDDHGLNLVQSRRQMPDTLCFGRIPESKHHRVLIQNGATMKIYLPHAGETALVQSFRKGYLYNG